MELQERLADARESGKLNLSYLGAAALDDALTQSLSVGKHIVELDLSSNELQDAALPLLLAALPRIRILRLKYNSLTRLPQLTQLPRLEHLDLDGNRIESIDEAALASLPDSLRRLSLSSNGLIRLPEGIGVTCCRLLATLDVSNNLLSALPDSLGGCPSLTHLDASSCRLMALPASLAQSRSLQRLFCQNNELQRVPAAFGHMSGTLKEWNLRANRLPLKYEQAKERGLSKFLAFLRDEEEIERLQEIERNRPVGIASGPCMVYRCKVVLEDAVTAADAGEPTDGFAWIRHGYAACQHKSSVFLWGGVVIREGRKTAELLVLNTDTMEWRVQPTRGDRPCPRDGHAMAVDEAGQHLLVFGGRKEAGGRRLAELHFLDLSSFTWFAPKIDSAQAPSPREQCTAVFIQNKFLVFGGRTNGARLNDLWAFDIGTFSWEQLPTHGITPSPRQGSAACVHEGKLWIMGGQANFVLDDLFIYHLEAQEWQPVTIAGRSKAAARAGGHVITIHDGVLHMFGGRDALGAQVSQLLRLRKMAGGARYEWVETEFSLLPNRSRVMLFDSFGRLCIFQSGHPLHKLDVDVQQIEQGNVIWDVTQVVPLSDVKDKVLRPEDSARLTPKQDRIRHASIVASKLPPTFTTHTPGETRVMDAAAAFCQRWAAEPMARGRLPPCMVLLNECEVPKVVCTALRPARLPHVELYDVEGISQFVADFFTCEPLEKSGQPPAHLVSPWSLLEWQAGDSFDLATLACSLLLGAGYNAYIVVGYTTKQVATGDQSRSECPFLKQHAMEAPDYGELPELEASFEVEPQTEPEPEPEAASAAAEGADQPEAGASDEGAAETAAGDNAAICGASSQQGEAADTRADSSGSTAASVPGPLPEVATEDGQPRSQAIPPEQVELEAHGAQQDAGTSLEAQPPAAPVVQHPKRYIHAFVLVKPGRREVCQPLLLDPCTGCQYSMDSAPCSGVEFAWSATNFWVNLQCSSCSSGDSRSDSRTLGQEGSLAAMAAPPGLAELAVMDWTFTNPNCWLPLLLSKEDQHDARTLVTQASMHSKHGSTDPGLLQRLTSSRPSMLLGRLPSVISTRGMTPRTQALIGSAVAAAATADVGSSTTGSGSTGLDIPGVIPGKGDGVRLSHLAVERNATPRQGFLAHRELMDSSLAYLSPDLSGMPVLQRQPTLAVTRTSTVGAGHLAPAGGGSLVLPPSHLSQLGSIGPVTAAPAGSLPALPEMPLSWVPALAVSRERLDSRCPRGEKAVLYRQAKRELYAKYGECFRWDGLVERLTTYADPECSTPLAVLELFERRRDWLASRLISPTQRASLVTFEPGAAFCLRSLRTVRPVGQAGEVELAFYHDARADGLMRRHCTASGMEEWFLPGSRPDRLVHRTTQYADAAAAAPGFGAAVRKTSDVAAIMAAGAAASNRGSMQPASTLASIWEPQDKAVASIQERYSRPESAADADRKLVTGQVALHGREGAVLERCFELAESRLILVLEGPECPDGTPAPLTRTYDLGGFVVEGGEAQDVEQRRREYSALRTASTAAQAAVRDAEEETRRILASRQLLEQGAQLVATAFFDATRIKVEDSDSAEALPEEDDSYDFLLTFLPSTGARDMTAAEAEEAITACLAAFDDRVAERQRVLHSRLAESGAEVARLRGVLCSELQHLGPTEMERVRQEEALAAFQLHVAQRRAQELPVLVQQRRRELEAKLTADKRLAAALAAGH